MDICTAPAEVDSHIVEAVKLDIDIVAAGDAARSSLLVNNLLNMVLEEDTETGVDSNPVSNVASYVDIRRALLLMLLPLERNPMLKRLVDPAHGMLLLPF